MPDVRYSYALSRATEELIYYMKTYGLETALKMAIEYYEECPDKDELNSRRKSRLRAVEEPKEA